MNTVAKIVEVVAAAGPLVFVAVMEKRWQRAHGHAAGREASWRRGQELTRAAVTPAQNEQARTALDVAFEQATAQYHAGLETGQGGRMPTREQVAADLASVAGEHDRVALSTGELLAFAALAAGFRRAFRPPIGSERTDPDGTTHRW